LGVVVAAAARWVVVAFTSTKFITRNKWPPRHAPRPAKQINKRFSITLGEDV
jgi:hypothetical protein